ncbi:Uncharacterized protein Rs2_27157 [Raphanus sativus]|nr:Uncharacterized protein Rs2_27157 [Raphanus sativus]
MSSLISTLDVVSHLHCHQLRRHQLRRHQLRRRQLSTAPSPSVLISSVAISSVAIISAVISSAGTLFAILQLCRAPPSSFGHGSFSSDLKLNSVAGHLLHFSTLVHYHGWRISHITHHQNHEHIENNESWIMYVVLLLSSFSQCGVY